MKQYPLFIISIILLLPIGACKHQHEDPHEGHSHNAKVEWMAYNDQYEIWAEAEPFSVETPSTIRLHLTDLKDFKPAEVQSVTVGLITGDKEIRQTQEKTESPGIYLFEIQPKTIGEGKLFADIQTAGGTVRLYSSAVKIYEDEHDALHQEEKEGEAHSGSISFTKEQSWKTDFATGLPVRQNFGQVIKTTARIQSSQGDENIIAARTGGIVIMEGNDVVEGKSVSAGQSLFTISGAGMADNNLSVRFAEAQNNYMKAQANYERAQDLVSDKIVSDKDFLQLKGDYETSKALYDNLRKNFSANGQRVASPGNGFVKQLFVSNGQYVEPGQALVSISKNKTLLLKAEVRQKYIHLLPYVHSANIRNINEQTVYSLEDLNGRFLSFGKSLTEDSYLIPVTFQIDNKAGFIPGGFVEVFIRTKSEQAVLTIPNEALTEDQGTFFVFVQHTPEEFEKREVKTGVTDGKFTEIISGLSDTERIVTKGAVSVKLAQQSGALDPHAGHVH